MMYYIYRIVNQVNNKHYVGYTCDPKTRWKNHKHAKYYRPLYISIQKHGIENFSFEVIYEHKDKKHILEMEKHFIKLHQAYTKGYNLTIGGEDSNSVESRRANSERMKLNNPMTKLRVNNGSFKKGNKPIITDERNEKIRQSKLGSKNHNFGNKEAANQLNATIYTCEHCSRTMNLGNYRRWHGNKCRWLTT